MTSCQIASQRTMTARRSSCPFASESHKSADCYDFGVLQVGPQLNRHPRALARTSTRPQPSGLDVRPRRLDAASCRMLASSGDSPTLALTSHQTENVNRPSTSPARPLSGPSVGFDPAPSSSRLARRIAVPDCSAAADWDPVEIMGSGKESTLKSRASSGELGLLFDRAVRLAELDEAEREKVLSTIATGRAIGN